MFAYETGLDEEIEIVHHETSPTVRNELVFAQNPLGRVPILQRAGAPAITDSDVICAYLDTLHHGRRLIPENGEQRWRALTMQAVAQGMVEAGRAVRWETVRRPVELRYPLLCDGYIEKLISSYNWLEREIDVNAPIDVGQISIATALSWIRFRALPDFYEGRPRLSAWLNGFEERASMRSTPLSGNTIDQ